MRRVTTKAWHLPITEPRRVNSSAFNARRLGVTPDAFVSLALNITIFGNKATSRCRTICWKQSRQPYGVTWGRDNIREKQRLNVHTTVDAEDLLDWFRTSLRSIWWVRITLCKLIPVFVIFINQPFAATHHYIHSNYYIKVQRQNIPACGFPCKYSYTYSSVSKLFWGRAIRQQCACLLPITIVIAPIVLCH